MLGDHIWGNIIRNGSLYINTNCSKFSVVPIEGKYKKYAEWIAEKYPGYCIDENKLVKNVSD
jgi:hypothetical protein